MLKLTIPENIDRPVPVYQGRSLEPGKTYVCSNRFVGQMLLSRWRVKIFGRSYPIRTLLKIENWNLSVSLFSNANFNGCHIWLCRGGGWGDLLAMTPLIRYIKEKWPRCHVHVACGKEHHELFLGMDVIPELIPVPFDPTVMLIDFEELVEGDPAAEHHHLIDLFAIRAGITLENRDIHYERTTVEFRDALRTFPRTDKQRVGVQFLASALYRSYPSMQLVIKELAKDFEVLIFGVPGQVEFKPYPNVVNLMDHNLSFRQSAAVVSTCDVCVSPDSAMVHLCSALNVPCVALYGPIPSILRAGDSTHPIDGKAPCAPCYFHADRMTDFPVGMPCAEKRQCIALDSIPVEKIVDLVYSLTKPASCRVP